MAQTEETLCNNALGELLISRHPGWNQANVHIERTGTLQANPDRQVDVLVESALGQPVAIEAEFEPARNVESEAIGRLNEKLASSGRVIESAISVKYPPQLRHGAPSCLQLEVLNYATHQLDEDGQPQRWPERGWVQGDVDALADAIEAVSLSERLLAEGADILEQAVHRAASQLRMDLTAHTHGLIADTLHQQDGIQTTRMAVWIVASAFVFHRSVEGQPEFPLLQSIRDEGMSKSEIFRSWRAILRVNYWPIFSIALDVLAPIPDNFVWRLAEALDRASGELAKLGATTFHDLAGRTFQTLISDRKFLATFYTLPSSACLLAELAVGRLDVDWKDPQRIAELRIADLACGTGALLSAVQRAIYRRHRRSGGNDYQIHRSMMERTLIGTDIMPAATHITASMLSSAYPGLPYGDSMIHTVPYGTGNWGLSIGALDLLERDQMDSLFQAGRQMRGKGEASRYWTAPIPHGSCDLVIMNPPFTRSTGHEAKKIGVPVPSFAGFATTNDEQRIMSRELNRTKKTFGHGNAGLGSNFMDLAHRKLKPGGVLALVLPFTFNNGRSWGRARKGLAERYKDIRIVSIAATGSEGQAFSADTGMAECLVLATKGERATAGDGRKAMFSNVTGRPKSLLEAQVLARAIRSGENALPMQRVPSGSIVVGSDSDRPSTIQGSLLDAGLAGVRDGAVAATVRELQAGKLHFPRRPEALKIGLVPLREVADRGLYHMDINGRAPRGAFDIRQPLRGEIPTYPVLWNHRAEAERALFVRPDRCGSVRAGCDEKAAAAWEKASRLHFSVDFRLNSQSLAMCLTTEPSLGGTAWPNVLTYSPEYEEPLLLWSNSTLGLMLYWWIGTRQQQGRARVKITALPALRVLDPRQFSGDQRAVCDRIFSAFESRTFLPANEAYRDSTRKHLDHAILIDLLGMPKKILEPLDLLRLKWCAEPSVHGGKNTRPSP